MESSSSSSSSPSRSSFSSSLSWYDRIARLNLPKRVYSEFTLEPVFVCGNRFVGKTRIIQELIDEEPEYCHASMIDYDSFKTNYGDNDLKIIEYMLKRRTSNMIYEHSVLCVVFDQIIKRYVPLLIRKSNNESIMFRADRKILMDFISDCRKSVSKLTMDRTVIILLNVVGEFYRNFKNNLPYLYLQTLAYVSVINELSNVCTAVTKLLIAYDPTDIDDTLREFKVYDMLFESASPLTKRVEIVSIANDGESSMVRAKRYESLMNRFRRIVKNVVFENHKYDILSSDMT
jgi:hypothetical protein